jgi:hypothetical protein
MVGGAPRVKIRNVRRSGGLNFAFSATFVQDQAEDFGPYPEVAASL